MDEDYRLAPILDDTAPYGQQWQDLFSLDLPPIQDPGFANAQYEHSHEQTHEQPVTPTHARQNTGFDFTPSSTRRTQGPVGAHHSTLPIASVLNEEQFETQEHRGVQDHSTGGRQQDHHEGDGRPSQLLHLPQPNVQYATDDYVPLIPPLLQGLHDPPPDAGLFPRITEANGQRRLVPAPSIRRTLECHIDPALTRPTESAPTHHQQVTTNLAQRVGSPQRKPPKGRAGPREGPNKKWSKEETLDLLKGVSKHGMGAWKIILDDTEFEFMDRTPVDLKDRYRVCRSRNKKLSSNDQMEPGAMIAGSDVDAIASKSTLGRSDAASKPTVKEMGESGLDADALAAVKSRKRKERKDWSAEEDAAVLSGYEKHGAKWAEIAKDPALRERRRNDARDRWRVLNKNSSQGEQGPSQPPASTGAQRSSGHPNDEAAAAFVDPSATWTPGLPR